MKKNFISGALIALIFLGVGCSNDETTQMNDSNSKDVVKAFGDGVGAGLAKSSLDKPFTLTYSSPEEKDSIMTDLIDEIDLIKLNSYPDTGNGVMSDEFSLNIVDNGFGSLTITPVYDPTPVPVITSDCGKGTGWKNFGTSSSSDKPKIKQLSEAAATHFSNGVEIGDCLEIRLKKNGSNVTVCARVVSCD